MPIHDWKKVEAGIYHSFHKQWTCRIAEMLNAMLPKQYYALVEQNARTMIGGRFSPDLLMLGSQRKSYLKDDRSGSALLTKPAKPGTQSGSRVQSDHRRKNIVCIRHVTEDAVVALIEIVSPGNKASQIEFDRFVDKFVTLLDLGIHGTFVDPFRSTSRDPQGVHAAIWEQLTGEKPDAHNKRKKPLAAVGYECQTSEDWTAYIEEFQFGDPIPDCPIFLDSERCVMIPLEETYRSAYATFPERWRTVLETEPDKTSA